MYISGILFIILGFNLNAQIFEVSYGSGLVDKDFSGNVILYLSKEKKSPKDIFIGLELTPVYRVIVKKLKANEAIVILAHPHLISHSDDTVVNIIDMLVENKLDGLELYYPNIDPKKRKKLLKIAKTRDLLLTGGSDFHGLNRLGIDIGSGNISIKVYQNMVDRKKL